MLNLTETADIHYRYKMPKIESATQSSGNGIKTALKNVSKVARCLSRPTLYLCKYLAFELGCICKWDEKADVYILMGQHDNERLQALIYTFIKKFVLCPNCNNPETSIVVGGSAKKPDVSFLCSACGSSSPLPSKHKLIPYIVKNPPSEEFKPVTTGGQNENKMNSGGDEDVNGQNESDAKFNSEESDCDAKDCSGFAGADQNINKSDLDSELKKLQVKAKEDTIEMKFEKFEDRLRPHLTIINNPNETLDSGLIRGLAHFAVELGIRSLSPVILAKNMFVRSSSDSSQDLKSCINASWKQILSIFLANHVPSQLNFLVGIEDLMCKPSEFPFAFSSLPSLALKLYEDDFISEEAFSTWYDRFVNSIDEKKIGDLNLNLMQQMQKSIKPFIEWLKQSSEEESSSENEKEDVHKQSKQNEEQTARNGDQQTRVDDEESDIDIDDI